MLIDTHAHLDEQSFETDLDAVLGRAREAGVEEIFTIGISRSTSEAAVRLAEQHSELFAVVGIQPNYVAEAQPDDFSKIEAIAEHSRVVAIGETGLDRYWDHAPLDLQKEYFVRHIELAIERDLPFIVHCRDAEDDVVEVLKETASGRQLRGVMHSFCGTAVTAEECLNLGMHISFAGMVTFKKNDELRSVASAIPLERLLVETDSPYLAPVPVRGNRNEPANVVHTARCLADVHELTLDKFAKQVTANTRKLFRRESTD
ncbi:putative deoxyribonuclease YcfH [Thalassoglobus neptunius]|uniref:Putative deoxyribonuclease YcfH n=1 Tax=Thalassoglobus neptunius TaxID=1938619 RepID=A0A5C5X8Z6_9PLAN|nr:TatD family hydrolase [Thalassoglobus neptunius]TWT58773.1 putative deoxyribonuclease YcfH [Thalassoglobus neptunius]